MTPLSITVIIALSIIVGFLIWKIRALKAELNYREKKHKRELNGIAKNSEKRIAEIEARATSLLKAEKQKSEQLQHKIDSVHCVACGEKSSGKRFCFSCYSKFKSHAVDIRFKNCNESEVIDYWGNLTEPCEDGRKVRSRAEQSIANYFYSNKIRYAYEKPINFEGKILKPDFYLPDYDLYIEYNELKDEEYLRKKDFAMQIYKKLKTRIIVMTKEDRENMYDYFCKLLQK